MTYQKWLNELKQLYFTMFGGILEESNPVWFDLYCEGYTPSASLEMTIDKRDEKRP